MALIKVFSGSEILALALQTKLNAVGIETITKNNIQSGILAGFGTLGLAVVVFVEEEHLAQAQEIVDEMD